MTNLPQKTVAGVMNSLQKMPAVQSRFNEILGKRKSKFISALVSLLNDDKNLSTAFIENPMSVLQVAMKAATFDLPVDNSLGYAYIVPFKKDGKPSAQFILGYKGIIQLAMRSRNYSDIGAREVREGELVDQDPLYGHYTIDWIKNPLERNKKPIIGYIAGIKTRFGFEKQLFMTKEEIIDYEQKHRRGQYQSPSWRNFFDSMALKTVLRKLLGTYGMLSIDIESDANTMKEIENDDDFDSESIDIISDDVPDDVDPETGEIKDEESKSE